MRTPRTRSSHGLSRTFCHGCFSGSLFMEGLGDGRKITAPRTDAAEHHREEKDAAGHGHEAADAHDGQAEIFAEGAHVLLGAVLFAAEAVGTGQRKPEAEDRLSAAEEQLAQERQQLID